MTVQVRFIQGPVNVEDVARIPGTDWLVGSGMASPGVPDGRLHVVHAFDGTWWPLTPDDIPIDHDTARFGGLGVPETSGFDPHGVTLRPGADGVHELYVVNHGGRESIEVYAVRCANRPELTWIGAIAQDTNVWGNAVAQLPGGGLVATNFLDLTDAEAMDKIVRGDVTGNLKEWRPGEGWSDLPGTETCAPNGVEASPDGRRLFICGWGTRRVIRVSRGRDPVQRDEVAVEVMPDNVNWGADGRLLFAGSVSTPAEVFAEVNARHICPIPLRTIRVDPETLAVEEAVYLDHEVFGTAATGYDVGPDLWIASPRSDRIAVFPGLGAA